MPQQQVTENATEQLSAILQQWNTQSQQDPNKASQEKVIIPVSQFLNMLKGVEEFAFLEAWDEGKSASHSNSFPPTHYFVQQCTVRDGVLEKNSCRLWIDFQVLVVADGWTKVPLLESSTHIVHHCSITKISSLSASPLPSSTNFTVVKPTNEETKTEEEDTPTNPNYNLGVVQGFYQFIVSEKGYYRVSLQVTLPYMSTQKTSLQIRWPMCIPKNQVLRFTIPGAMQVRVEPFLETNCKIETNSESESSTIVQAIFPATDRLCIYWTPKEEEEEEEEEQVAVQKEKVVVQQPLNVSVDQNTLYSVGGGVLAFSSNFQFQITNGSVNTFQVLVIHKLRNGKSEDTKKQQQVRVLRVEGNAIAKWDIRPFVPSARAQSEPSEMSFGSTGSSILQQQQLYGNNTNLYLLRVFLDVAQQDNYNFKVFGEVDVAETCKEFVPLFSCLTSHREKGFLAVEATSSVEIKPFQTRILTPMDTKELPNDLTSRASDQLLHGYKFLTTKGIELGLDVKKHEEVAVLVAVIEEAQLQAIISQSGHVMYSISLKIRNTSQDYLKVSLPKAQGWTHQLWTTMVAGRVVRPAMDKDDLILLPLKQSDTESVFTAQIVYISSMDHEQNQKFDFYFPTFNVPINLAGLEIKVPRDYQCEEFQGDLPQIPYWKQTYTIQEVNSREESVDKSKHRNAAPQMQMRLQQMPQMQQMQQVQQVQQMQPIGFNVAPNMNRNRSMNRNDDDELERQYRNYESESESDSEGEDEEEDEEDEHLSQQANPTVSSTVLGILPIKVQLQTSSRMQSFYFEQMLVSVGDEPIHLHVKYRKSKKGYFEKRHLYPASQVLAFSGLVALGGVIGFVAVSWLKRNGMAQ